MLGPPRPGTVTTAADSDVVVVVGFAVRATVDARSATSGEELGSAEGNT